MFDCVLSKSYPPTGENIRVSNLDGGRERDKSPESHLESKISVKLLPSFLFKFLPNPTGWYSRLHNSEIASPLPWRITLVGVGVLHELVEDTQWVGFSLKYTFAL